ncbi:MAG: metal ABC transporter substrate-binding protein [Candidatus Kapabacteria bacterium]|jgi:zinc transport system substrate-binding protein|nr:metal ABC transporter substrate-binding protein [Candidatus Kapabacteria bacterium]
MKNVIILLTAVLFLTVIPQNSCAKKMFVASNNPTYMILTEIIGTRATLYRLVPPGASPHTYEPTASDMLKLNTADGVFYISDHLDAWVAKRGNSKIIALTTLLPKANRIYFGEKHSHEGHKQDHKGHKHDNEKDHRVVDPHFWTDPQAVKALLPGLLKTLTKLDPGNAAVYSANAKAFSKRLDLLHVKCEKILKPFRGESIFLFHPSFRYFLKRYNMVYAGAIETSPGKEPTMKTTARIIKKIKASGTKALFTEPQLPKGPAKVIAEAANLKIFVLDPVGGDKGKKKYSDLILYNAKVFARAL